MDQVNLHTILCFNSGSSSLKFALYRRNKNTLTLLLSGAIENIGPKKSTFWVTDKQKKQTATKSFTHHSALKEIFITLEKKGYGKPKAIGHRVVHGGKFFSKPTRISKNVLSQLRKIIHFAPLHLPAEIKIIEWLQKKYPKIPQVACFDTAIYHQMPLLAKCLPFSKSWMNKGIMRYGFHGISYESILKKLRCPKKQKTIIAHLGNGASISAFLGSKPVETTMSFTPTSGIMMGTRSGDLDPGLLIYLLREQKYSVQKLEKLVNESAGLKGVSGISENMQVLLASKKPQAKLAVDLFCYHAKRAIGSLAVVLGGIDLLVFTGGIGERSAEIRKRICQDLEFLNLQIEASKNRAHSETVSTRSSSCVIKVLKTDEDQMIAEHTIQVIKTKESA